MTRADALRELLAKVEAGEWFPGLAQRAIGGVQTYNYAREAFHGSLDAAKALHEAVLPGWDVDVEIRPQMLCDAWVFEPAYGRDDGKRWIGTSEAPARAWLIAILKALIATEDN